MEESIPSVQKSHTPKWLKNLQRNSWEPEVFISGIILAFIFAFPAQLFDFSARLIQDFNFEFIGAYIFLLYASMTVNMFKIFFIVHLLLRFVWAGLLGMSYAFPDGVNKEKLFKNSRELEYKKPVELVEKLERLCSMTFAFPASMGALFTLMIAYFSFLMLIYSYLNVSFMFIYFFFLGTLLTFSFYLILVRKSKFKLWFGKTLINNTQAIYQSNLGKWYVLAYTLFIFILTIPLVIQDTKDFLFFNTDNNLKENHFEWPDDGWYFSDQREPNNRFARVLAPSKQVTDAYSTLTFAQNPKEFAYISLVEKFKTYTDSIGWQKIENEQDLYRVYVNDTLLETSGWSPVRMPQTGQKGYQTLIDVSNLEPGIHTIRIEKLVLIRDLFNNQPDIRHRKNWARFDLLKVG